MTSMSSDVESAPTVFRPDRAHLIGAAIMVLLSLMAVGMQPRLFFWIPVLPLLFIYWVLRAKTTVGSEGVSTRYAFSQPKSATWDDIEGVRFGGSKTCLHTVAGKEFALPGVTFNSLPALSEASQGRIPDALTAGLQAADDKVVVIHRDGRQVLKPKSED